MAEWFKHDYNARNDPKLVMLRIDTGHEGVGLYWSAIEILHEQGGAVPLAQLLRILQHEAGQHTTPERIAEYANAMQMHMLLHCTSNGIVTSDRVTRNLQGRKQLTDERRAAAKRRWDKDVSPDANALQLQSKSNAIREEKRRVLDKENQRARAQQPPTLADCITVFQRDGFGPESAQAFHDHYTAQDWHSGNGMRIVNWQAKAKRWMAEEMKQRIKDGQHKAQHQTRKQQHGIAALTDNANAIGAAIDSVQRGRLAQAIPAALGGGPQHADASGARSLPDAGTANAG